MIEVVSFDVLFQLHMQLQINHNHLHTAVTVCPTPKSSSLVFQLPESVYLCLRLQANVVAHAVVYIQHTKTGYSNPVRLPYQNDLCKLFSILDRFEF